MSLYRRWIYNWEYRLTLRDRNRRIFPFEWGLEWVGGDPEAGDPLGQILEYGRRACADSDRFYAVPERWHFERKEDRLYFPTPTPTPYDSNNRAEARLFPARRARAAVIVVPQWNAGPNSHLGLCRILRWMGMTAVRHCLPYHESRLPSGLQRADFMVSPNIGRTLHATRQAVLEVRLLAGWLRRQGYSQVAVMGTSIGSCVSYLAFLHEPELCTGVFNHVSSLFADVVWEGLSTRYVRWGLEGHIRLEELRDCWAPISPLPFIRKLKERYRPHLLVSARYDLTFPPHLSRRVFQEYSAWGIPCRYRMLPCGHYTTGSFPFKYLDGWLICNFLRQRLS